jgi:hypothetical protein
MEQDKKLLETNAKLEKQISEIRKCLKKEKQMVQFESTKDNDIVLELMNYLGLQGEILSSNDEINGDMLPKLKQNCKSLINIANIVTKPIY